MNYPQTFIRIVSWIFFLWLTVMSMFLNNVSAIMHDLQYTSGPVALNDISRMLPGGLATENWPKNLLESEKDQHGFDPLVQTKKLLASDGTSSDRFGYSVAIDGDTAIVGAHSADGGTLFSGAAYIFAQHQGGTDQWEQVAKPVAYDALLSDQFGAAVALSGDWAVVGASSDDDRGSNSGSAYIYYRHQGGTDNWGQVKKITALDGASNDYFGIAVGISGDTIVVGANYDDDRGENSGSAYIYSRHQGGTDNWGQVRKIAASDGAAGDDFGESVALNGDTIIIGAHRANSFAGSAYLFLRNQGGANNWGETKKLTAGVGAGSDLFGYSVSISGDSAIVGAYWDDADANNAGTAYLFSRNQGGSGNWGGVKKLGASDSAAGNWFGISVSISGENAAVGANYSNGSASGAVYFFNRNQGGTDNWGQVDKLVASDSEAADMFGYSVATTQNMVIVGAHSDADKGSGSGSAYLFANKTTATNYTVSASVDAFGILDKTSASVNQGATASFKVTPNTGYMINLDVAGDCPTGSWGGTSYTTGQIVADCSVHVTHSVITGSTKNCSGGAIKEIKSKQFDGETSSCTADFQINMGPSVTLEGRSNISLSAANVVLQPTVRVTDGSTLHINATTARVSSLNQVLLGSLSGATVRAYRLTDLENPIENSVQTVASGDVNSAGRFGLLLSEVAGDEWILVSATGGWDIDADDNGATNTPSTQNNGTLYGLAKAEEWRDGGVRVTALTDLVWRFTRSLTPQAAPSQLHIRLNDLAKALITADINGDGLIDYHDFHAFVPHEPVHRTKLNFDYEALLILDGDGNSVIGAHHAGDQELLEKQLARLFGAALNLYPRTDGRYDQVHVEAVLFGRGKVVGNLGGLQNDSEADPASNKAQTWLPRNPVTKLTLTATPIDTTQVLGWSGCDQVSTDLSQCTVALDQGHQIIAKFGYKTTRLHATLHDLSGAVVVLDSNSLLLSTHSWDMQLIDSLRLLEGGDFVTGPTDSGGFLRKVTAFEKIDKQTYRLSTEDASLKDVIAQGSFSFSSPLTNGDLRGYLAPSTANQVATMDHSALKALEGVRLIPSDNPDDMTFHLQLGEPAVSSTQSGISTSLGVVLWEDGQGGKLTVQGSVDFEISPELGISYGDSGLFPGVEDFHFVVSQKSKLNVKFSGEGELTLNEIKKKIATIPFGTYYVLVGGWPVWVVPEVSIYLGADAKAKLSLSAGVKAEMSQRNGVMFKKGVTGWKTINEPPSFSWDFVKPALTSEATLTGYVEASLQFVIYSVAGPLVGGQSYVQLQAIESILNEDIITGKGCQDGLEASLKFGINGFIKWELKNDVREFLDKWGFADNNRLLSFSFDLFKSEWLLKHWYLSGQCVDDPPFLKVSGDDMDILVDSTNRSIEQRDYLLTNIGSGKLLWTVDYSDDAAISVSPRSGELLKEGTVSVAVRVDTNQLELGIYRNRLTFENGFRKAESLPFGSLGSTSKQLEIKVAPLPSETPIITDFEDQGAGFGRIEWTFNAQAAPLELWGYEIYLLKDGTWSKLRTVTDIDAVSSIVSGLPKGEHVCFRMQAYGEYDLRTPNSTEHCVELSGGDLSLSVSESIMESGSATAILSRTGDLSQAISVYLDSSDTREITLPTIITIPQNANSTTFDVRGVQDGKVDGDQVVTLTAYLAGWGSDTSELTVFDEDSATPKTWQQVDLAGVGASFTKVGMASTNNIYFAKLTGSDIYWLEGNKLTSTSVPANVGQIFDLYDDTALVEENDKVGILQVDANGTWQSLNIPADKTTSHDGTHIWSVGSTVIARARGPRYISNLNGSWYYYCRCDGNETSDLWGPDASHYYEAYWSSGLGKNIVSYRYQDAGQWKNKLISDLPVKFIYGIPNGSSPGTIYGVDNEKIFYWADGSGVTEMTHPLSKQSGYALRGIVQSGGNLYVYGKGIYGDALILKLSGSTWIDVSPKGMHAIYDMWGAGGNLYVAAYDQVWFYGTP